MYPLWVPALSAVFGIVVGATMVLLGGVGVSRKLRMRVSEMEGDMHALSERITREQKRRAGNAAAEAREVAKSDKDLQREATELLAKENAGQLPLPKPFPSVFNRG